MTPARALPLPDAEARHVIQSDLDTNLLVEAGAGSGKTTELVARMVALVESGTAGVEAIAAVTFTRKAAAELRERFQSRLEARAGEVAESPDRDERLPLVTKALEDIDRAFIGTIHSFCARLLRERPLDVGLDPAFQELAAEEREPFRRRYWESYIERLTRDAAPTLEELSNAGLRPGQLYGLFDQLVDNPDVEFPASETDPPAGSELAAARTELDEIVSAGVELMPAREPEMGWDSLQKKLRTLAFTRDVTGWSDAPDFFDALLRICKDGPKGHAIVQKRWKDKAMAKALAARVDGFAVGDTPGHRIAKRWYAHRYSLALRLAHQAAADFAEHRRRAGMLDFQDLLMLTARLLRTDPHARRGLGRRYRRLLVDEFQDTDPLQAEVMMLLASDPEDEPAAAPADTPAALDQRDGDPLSEEASEGADTQDQADEGQSPEADWRTVTPRPGALFVVGDPKQSIYRFRRADIQLYDLVKRRFSEVGRVLELNTNFRSRPPIGELVNHTFDDPSFFPAHATPEQAGFEPLNTRPSDRTAPREGVFWYEVDPEAGTSRDVVTEDDAARLASWIQSRVASGERKPGDFMVLTRTKKYLATYARELEARGIPLQVSGAGVGAAEEVSELVTLLSCMVDPTDPVKVVAVLVGLFFGLDHERLVAHRMEDGTFDVVRLRDQGDAEVMKALRTLNGWWRSAVRQPSDVFVGSVVSELGLLPLAAAGELGSIRAGALRFAVDTVRTTALGGDASLPGAIHALEVALALKEAEAPLEPGRSDVVRLMNLHQAKGLEAHVVILADPSKQSGRSPRAHVERAADGSAVGYLSVGDGRPGPHASTVLARPENWDEKAVREMAFEEAEGVRLLYVAVTRARDELVVARWLSQPGKSVWSPLDPWLEEHAERLDLPRTEPEPRRTATLTPEQAREASELAADRLASMSVPSFRHASVTSVAKSPDPEGETPAEPSNAAGRPGEFRGYSWGSAVHAVLAAAAENPPEGALRATCRAHLVEQARPLDDHGDPVELDELLNLVRTVRASELWQRAQASPRMMAEVPFAAAGLDPDEGDVSPVVMETGSAGGRRQLDLFGRQDAPDESSAAEPEPRPEGPKLVLEGVVDLAFQEEGGWVIADYKTDIGTDPDFPARVQAYRRQVELYARAWTHLTGKPVKERVLFFTSQGRMESW
jgi:ATP-dependent helicase/nuclease subunit A